MDAQAEETHFFKSYFYQKWGPIIFWKTPQNKLFYTFHKNLYKLLQKQNQIFLLVFRDVLISFKNVDLKGWYFYSYTWKNAVVWLFGGNDYNLIFVSEH